ncbi:2OG-Fe(II) oxygenase [Peristeroidobacter soli]|jgi:predicted 2-oxoglutarate/Fe(II)-dependent dioxygenase YbiX|uniref:2OG-Fe(II) oxygenase n=1 Tax=Peristeroidobacter soli TaxID=2497877 RepID=UPI00101D9102|nr:2OG-Fe(II) oxygenase [Peristeroidobacter soli]
MERRDLTSGIFTISDVLTAEECREQVALADRRGFEVATITAQDGPLLNTKIRNNDRVIVDDVELAQRLWTRVGKLIPRRRHGRQVRGLNERLRYYRYTPGQQFTWHYDGAFQRDNGEQSLLTFMIYLNEGYEGGSTQFESLEVAGKQGMALLFEHELLHQGGRVTAGVKYVLRSDVMYGPLNAVRLK